MALTKSKLVVVAVAAAALVLAATPAAASVALGPRRGLKGGGGNANNNLNPLSAPTLECVDSLATVSSVTVSVCPGETGAPFGFSLFYEELESFIEHGGFPCGNGDADCVATITDAFLGEDDCWTVTIGAGPQEDVTFTPESCSDELACNTEFVFAAVANAGGNFNASARSETITCATLPCAEPDTCFTSSPSGVESCGLCRPSCGRISRGVVCEFYNVDDPACRISARVGGGNVCAGTDVCCTLSAPNSIEPTDAGVCSPLE